VANVIIDGKSLNEELVKAGYAWVYPQYCKIPACQKWYQYEAEARAQKIGLWSHPNPIPPWDFRRGKFSTSKETKAISTGIYRGNTRSEVFHQASCKDFNCKNCTEVRGGRMLLRRDIGLVEAVDHKRDDLFWKTPYILRKKPDYVNKVFRMMR